MKFVIVNSILYKVSNKVFKQFVEIGTDRIDSDDNDILELIKYIEESGIVVQTIIPVYMS